MSGRDLQHITADIDRAIAARQAHAAASRREIERLCQALQVCEYTVHRAEPTDADLHAAQQASGAYCTDWQPEHVFDDLPEFIYHELTEQPPRPAGEEAGHV